MAAVDERGGWFNNTVRRNSRQAYCRVFIRVVNTASARRLVKCPIPRETGRQQRLPPMSMFYLRRPPNEEIRRELAAQSQFDFTYFGQGTTRTNPPAGYRVDHMRAEIGSGEQAFQAACQALREWRQFQLGWVEAFPADTPLAVGNTVAVLGRSLLVWSTNFARIVYTIDETVSGVQQFGFAYGTLPDHIATGEERFVVSWDQEDDRVYYEILAFSRPHHLLAKIGYPLIRQMQRRFRRESSAAMREYVRKAKVPN